MLKAFLIREIFTVICHEYIDQYQYILNIMYGLFGWLVLWHINLCRLFLAKSIFM